MKSMVFGTTPKPGNKSKQLATIAEKAKVSDEGDGDKDGGDPKITQFQTGEEGTLSESVDVTPVVIEIDEIDEE